MNGVAIAMNKASFLWGRRAALDLAAVERVAAPPEAVPDSQRLSATLDEVISAAGGRSDILPGCATRRNMRRSCGKSAMPRRRGCRAQ